MSSSWLENETNEDIDYYKNLQLNICYMAIKDNIPYTDICFEFTDVEITEEEYNQLFANYISSNKNENILTSFISKYKK